MEVTNKQNLPETVVAAITTDHYTNPNERASDYSVTKLISPIQETVLKNRHEGDGTLIVNDVLDFFKSWVGSVIHNALEDAWKESMGSLVEKRFYIDILGKTLSGKVDCYEIDNKRLIDYKTMALYRYTKRDFKQYEEQANLYSMLLRHAGYPVEKLEIVGIILDWKKQEAKYKKGYPQAPIVTIELPLWDSKTVEIFAENRMRMLEDAKLLSDEDLYEKYPCSEEEKWQNPQIYAVVKSGAKRASRVFKTEEEATKYIESIHKKGSDRATKVFTSEEDARKYFGDHNTVSDSTHEIRHRFDTPRKCEEYCSCKMICKQYAAEHTSATEL